MVAWGVLGAVRDRGDVRPWEAVRWAVGANLLNDLIVIPLTLVVVALIHRIVPRPARAPVTWGVAATAILSLYAWPFVRGYGRNRTVPSLLNRDYGEGLAVLVGATWVIVAVWALTRLWRDDSARGLPSSDGPPDAGSKDSGDPTLVGSADQEPDGSAHQHTGGIEDLGSPDS